MSLRGASVVLSFVVLSCLKTTAHVCVRGQLLEEVAQVKAGFFQENVLTEGDTTQQQLLAKGMEDSEPAIWITSPKNDTTVFTMIGGVVVVAFETRGFPSGEIPIEVLIPQNGDKPTLLMERSNTITVSVHRPCTQLVTLFATARGQRVSTSVLFSTILDKAAIASARAPLPADAAWGIRSDAVVSLLREPDMDTTNTQMLENRAGLEVSQRRDNTASTEGTPSPISVVFVGPLNVDGQKHIWLHQIERLSRARFAPKYLTFHEEEEGEGDKSDAEGASPWKTGADDAEIFKRRLRDADVPLLRASFPRMDAGWIAEHIPEETTNNILMDIGFGAVLESFDSAGGKPRLMSPPWAREGFIAVADAIRRASPDVLVVPNSVSLGDAVITRAARWAMGSRGLKIIMDFPNVKPAQGIDVDLFATPSHYVARHPDVEALAKSTRTPVVVIPPGIEVSPTVTSPPEEDVSDVLLPGDFLHELACGSEVLKDSGCRDPDCHVIGFVGRLAPEKGPGLFLAVAEALAKLLPCAVFVVVGNGSLRLALEAMAGRLGIARRVHFTGWVDGADLERLLAEMSLLFNPSLAPETFSVINIQAMSAGTPVAAFGTGGMLEYLSANVNALVLDEAEPHKVATAVAELLLDRPRLDALAERGKVEVVSNFRAATAVERWAELYESLLDNLEGDGPVSQVDRAEQWVARCEVGG